MSERDQFNAMAQGMKGLAANGYLGQNNPNDDMSAYNSEEFIPPANMKFSKMSDGQDYNYEQQSTQGSQFREPQTKPNSPLERPYEKVDTYDEQLFPGGPNKSELESWRKQYDDLYIIDDIPGEQIFIYRTLNRYEYKAIMATPNTDPLMREEMICEQCVLFPYEYSYGNMANGNAGVVTVIASHIMETSGFTKASMPRRL